jgi:hypothetical protein
MIAVLWWHIDWRVVYPAIPLRTLPADRILGRSGHHHRLKYAEASRWSN